MQKRSIYLIVILLCLAVPVMLILRTSSNDPLYRGKRLSDWLGELVDNETNQTATIAVQTIGTNGLPYLFEGLSYRPNSFRLKTFELLDWLLVDTLHLRKKSLDDPRWIHWRKAFHGFEALGPAASNAVPSLAAMLDQPMRGSWAAYCLASIGAPALPILGEALTNRTLLARHHVLFAADDLRCDARVLVSPLIKCLNDTNVVDGFMIRHQAVLPLGKMRGAGAQVVPVLTNILADSNGSVRILALRALADLGPEAVAAVPAIKRALDDPGPRVRYEATNTLRQIAGDDR